MMPYYREWFWSSICIHLSATKSDISNKKLFYWVHKTKVQSKQEICTKLDNRQVHYMYYVEWNISRKWKNIIFCKIVNFPKSPIKENGRKLCKSHLNFSMNKMPAVWPSRPDFRTYFRANSIIVPFSWDFIPAASRKSLISSNFQKVLFRYQSCGCWHTSIYTTESWEILLL